MIGIIITIVIGVPSLVFAWQSLYKKMHPKELADRHQKEIVAKGLCPKCGSDKVDYEPEIDYDGVGPNYLGYDKGVCKDCGHKWEAEECHYDGDLRRIK